MRETRAVTLVVLASVLFAGVFTVRLAVSADHEELVLLYALPVALLGVGLGPRAGLAGAGVAGALLVAWVLIQDVELSPADYVIRATGYLALGVGLGSLSERRDRDANLLAAVVEGAADAVYLKDRDGRYLFVNEAGAQMIGRRPRDVVGRTDEELRNGHAMSAAASDDRVLRTGAPERVELPLGAPEEARVISSVKSPYRDRTGRVLGVVEVARDISERAAAEASLRESEERFRLLVDSVEEYAITMLDGEGRITSWNRGAQRITGHRADAVLGAPLEVLYPPEAVAAGAPARALEEARQTGRFSEQGARLHRDGSRYCADVAIVALPEGVAGFAVVIHDITARLRAEDELRAAEKRFRRAFEEAPTGIALAGLDRVLFQANAALAAMLGTSPDTLVGRPVLAYCAEEHAPLVRAALDELAAGTRDGAHGELQLRGEDGRLCWALVSLTLVRDEHEAPAYYVVQAQDVTERHRAQAALAHQALHDPLTGLPNRTLLLDRLDHALERGRREPGATAVLFVDLDRFKPINDSLGHAAGDVVLVEVARRLGEVLRAGDTVARLGGDEFVIVAERLDQAEDALVVAQRALASLREPLEVHGHVLHLDASIGIAFADGDAPDELLRNADAAMYEAKQRRSEHALYSERMRRRTSGRLELEAGLRRALDAGEIDVHYQPQIDLGSGTMIGVEGLARWQDPERGLVLPGTFVPLAEETGLIRPLGEHVLDVACRDAARWTRGAPGLVVAVNLSASQFAEPGLVCRVSSALEASGLDPAQLCLEITETTVMRDVQAARTVLEALKALGVRIAIDDFGTGYSSLSYLTRLPVDVLKIDRSFVQGLDRAEEAALVGAIIAMGHALGVTIVAEGIETDAQVEELIWLTCDVGQGFRFGRPGEREALDRLLRSGRRFGPPARFRRPLLRSRDGVS